VQLETVAPPRPRASGGRLEAQRTAPREQSQELQPWWYGRECPSRTCAPIESAWVELRATSPGRTSQDVFCAVTHNKRLARLGIRASADVGHAQW